MSTAEQLEDKGERRTAAIARHVRRQRQQWAKPGAGLGRRLRQLGLDEGLFLEQRIAPRRGATRVFQLFGSVHETGPDLQSPDRPRRRRWQIPQMANQVLSAACFGGFVTL